jgi:hypothetical protein
MNYAEHITQGNQMEVAILAYIAGIVDGEGSIMIQRQCSESFMAQRAERGCFHPHYAVAVRIGMLERIALDLIVNELKIGKVCEEKPYHHKRPMFRWMVRSKEEVVKFLNLILPYLRIKKKQALLAIKFMDEWVSFNGIRLTPEILAQREQAWGEMRKLNGVIDTPATTKPRGIRGREKSAPYDAIV